MTVTLWSKGVELPVEWNKNRSVELVLPSFDNGVLSMDTLIGYEKVDLENYMDGIHKRNVYLVVLGFGIVFKTNWNDDGRYK